MAFYTAARLNTAYVWGHMLAFAFVGVVSTRLWVVLLCSRTSFRSTGGVQVGSIPSPTRLRAALMNAGVDQCPFVTDVCLPVWVWVCVCVCGACGTGNLSTVIRAAWPLRIGRNPGGMMCGQAKSIWHYVQIYTKWMHNYAKSERCIVNIRRQWETPAHAYVCVWHRRAGFCAWTWPYKHVKNNMSTV